MRSKPCTLAAILMFAIFGIERGVCAQSNAVSLAVSTNSAAVTPVEKQLAALRSELTNAYSHVVLIVNRPVKAYARIAGIDVEVYKPGWFHDGAIKPNFNTVDVRQTQELPYAPYRYVSSDLNPGMVFLGQDCEFNSMTKYFYANRRLPKRKLSEPEMLEINRLYRVIGRCQSEINQLSTAQEIGTP